MKHLGIFSDSTTVQSAIDSNELVKPYIVLTGQSGSRLVDYNTLTKSPIEYFTEQHPLEVYNDRFTYYYVASAIIDNEHFDGSGDPMPDYVINKSNNDITNEIAYAGSSNYDTGIEGCYRYRLAYDDLVNNEYTEKYALFTWEPEQNQQNYEYLPDSYWSFILLPLTGNFDDGNTSLSEIENYLTTTYTTIGETVIY